MTENQPSPHETYSSPVGYGGQSVTRPIFRPYVTYILIGICVVVYLLQVATNGNPNLDVTQMLDKDNSLIMQGQETDYTTSDVSQILTTYLGRSAQDVQRLRAEGVLVEKEI